MMNNKETAAVAEYTAPKKAATITADNFAKAIKGGEKATAQMAANLYHGNLHKAIDAAFSEVQFSEKTGKPDYAPIYAALPVFDDRAMKDHVTNMFNVWAYAEQHGLAALQTAYDDQVKNAKRKSDLSISGLKKAITPKKSQPASAEKSDKDPFTSAVSMAQTLAKFCKKQKFNDDELAIIFSHLTADKLK